MLHFYQILHFSSNLLSPESGRFTFLRATVGLHSGSSLQYNIAIFSTDWIRHQLFWSEDDFPPATRQSPPPLSISHSQFISAQKTKNTGFNLSLLCVHWPRRGGVGRYLPLLGEQFEKLSVAAGPGHNFGVEKSSFFRILWPFSFNNIDIKIIQSGVPTRYGTLFRTKDVDIFWWIVLNWPP